MTKGKGIRGDPSSPEGALALVRDHGIMLESGRGPVASLAEAIAGERIHGSWWAHPAARAIFRGTRAVRDSPDVLVCRLIEGRITYIHRRLWPAVVRLSDEFGRSRLSAIKEQHTPSGAHRLVTIPFARWVPDGARAAAAKLSRGDARRQCGEWMARLRRHDVERAARTLQKGRRRRNAKRS